MTRYEDEVQRAARRLHAASFSVLINGGALEEAEQAFTDGIAEAQAMLAREAAWCIDSPAEPPAPHVARHDAAA